ncbi:MAG: hypothetical protein AAFX93_00905 [Verrucomicrobiota bacterium]
MKFLLCLIVALLASVSSWGAAKADWQSVSCNDDRLTLMMPGKPVKTQKSDSSIVGNVKSVLYTVKFEGIGGVTVDCSDIPGTALFFAGADTIYSNAKGSLLSKVHGKTDTWTDINIDGHQGKKLTYRTPPSSGHPGYTGEAQMFLIGNYLYIISVLEMTGEDTITEDKVFASLKFSDANG